MRPKCGPFDVFHSSRSSVTSLRVERGRSTFTCLRSAILPLSPSKGKLRRIKSLTWNWNVLFGRGNFEQSLNECRDGKGPPTSWSLLCGLGNLWLSLRPSSLPSLLSSFLSSLRSSFLTFVFAKRLARDCVVCTAGRSKSHQLIGRGTPGRLTGGAERRRRTENVRSSVPLLAEMGWG